jgi:hypothetical protein
MNLKERHSFVCSLNVALQEAQHPEPSSPTISATSNADQGEGRVLLVDTLFLIFNPTFQFTLWNFFRSVASQDWVLRDIYITSHKPHYFRT